MRGKGKVFGDGWLRVVMGNEVKGWTEGIKSLQRSMSNCRGIHVFVQMLKDDWFTSM